MNSDEFRLVEHPRDPRCAITSVVLTAEHDVVYTNANVSTREAFEEPVDYIPCAGINLWEPKKDTIT